MKPTHTKFLSRYQAELLSSICVATEENQITFGSVFLTINDEERGFQPTLEPRMTALISINSPAYKEGHRKAKQLVLDPNQEAAIVIDGEHDGPPKLAGFWNPLKLKFHDIDPSGCGDEFLSMYTLFDEPMADLVLDYLLEVEQAPTVFAVWAHCQAGISRSAGVSKFVADIYKLYFPESYVLYNKHVYSTLRTAYNMRLLHGRPVPGVLA